MADKTANADKGRAEASSAAHVQKHVPEMTREPDYAPPWMTMDGAPFVVGSEGVRRAAGNLAVQRYLRAGVIQAKLKIDQPGDPDEREADRVADSIISSHAAVNVQRKCSACAAGATCSKCQEEQLHAKLQPGRGDLHSHEAGASSVHAALRSAGRPLNTAARAFFEPRFAADFRGVRVHTGGEAAQAARSIGARAFTAGSDVVFADGEYAPETDEGRRLLAHELTHVVQQGETAHAPRVQRQTPDAPAPGANAADGGTADGAAAAGGQATPAAPTTLIVDDSVTALEPQQMRRGEFLSQLRSAVDTTVEQTLAGSPLAPVMRPQVSAEVERQFALYAGMDARALEASARQRVPGAATAGALIPPVCEQVRRELQDELSLKNVKQEVGGAAEAVMNTAGEVLGGAADAVGGAVEAVGSALSGLGAVFFKAREGGARRTGDAATTPARLGGGQALDGRLSSSVGAAFGRDFSGVRVHADTGAAQLAGGMNARAFTVGQDIAFGAGEYQPGTLTGDALIAHELAHVAQQSGARATDVLAKDSAGEGAFEEDADMAAVGAVASLWARALGGVTAAARAAGPALRSGLSLRRCEKKNEEPTPQQATTAPTSTTPPPPPPPPEPLYKQFKTGPEFQAAIDKVVNDMGGKIDTSKVEGGKLFYFGMMPEGEGDTSPPNDAEFKRKNKKANKKPFIRIFPAAFGDGWPLLATTCWHEYRHALQMTEKKGVNGVLIPGVNVKGHAQEAEAYCYEVIAAEEQKLHLEKDILTVIKGKEQHYTGQEYVREVLWRRLMKHMTDAAKGDQKTLQPLFAQAIAAKKRMLGE